MNDEKTSQSEEMIDETGQGSNKSMQEISSPNPTQASGNRNMVPIVAIITAAVVLLGCIISCSAISIFFIINAPW